MHDQGRGSWGPGHRPVQALQAETPVCAKAGLRVLTHAWCRLTPVRTTIRRLLQRVGTVEAVPHTLPLMVWNYALVVLQLLLGGSALLYLNSTVGVFVK